MHEHSRAAHERSRILLEPDGNGALHQAIVYTGDSLCPALPRIASNLHKKLLRSTVCPTEALMFSRRSRPEETTDRRILTGGPKDSPKWRGRPASREYGLSPEEHTRTGTLSPDAGTRHNFVDIQTAATAEVAKSTTAHDSKDTQLNSLTHGKQPHMTIPRK